MTDLAQGAVALVDKHEKRRGAMERLLSVLKIKLLEIRRKELERKLEPHLAAREAAGERLQELEAKRIAILEEEGSTRADWRDANTRIVSIEGHIRRIGREIRELRSGEETA